MTDHIENEAGRARQLRIYAAAEVIERVALRQSDEVEVGPVQIALALADAGYIATEERWWIATERLSKGGRKILGPFGSRDLALEVRVHVERAHGTDQYWVVSEDE